MAKSKHQELFAHLSTTRAAPFEADTLRARRSHHPGTLFEQLAENTPSDHMSAVLAEEAPAAEG